MSSPLLILWHVLLFAHDNQAVLLTFQWNWHSVPLQHTTFYFYSWAITAFQDIVIKINPFLFVIILLWAILYSNQKVKPMFFSRAVLWLHLGNQNMLLIGTISSTCRCGGSKLQPKTILSHTNWQFFKQKKKTGPEHDKKNICRYKDYSRTCLVDDTLFAWI